MQSLVNAVEKVGYVPELFKSVEAVNYHQKYKLFANVNAYFAWNLAGKRNEIWGLSFKSNTDDIRDALSRLR